MVATFGSARNPVFWGCALNRSHKHFMMPIRVNGPMSSISVSYLPAFLHYVVCMKSNMRMVKVRDCLADVHGIVSTSTFSKWYEIYTDMLQKCLAEVDGLKIGGPNQVVVVDETYAKSTKMRQGLGAPGRKGRKRDQKHIANNIAAQTVWKRPAAAVLKKPACCKRPAANENRWIWGAVEVGERGQTPKSHAQGDKRVYLSMLPHVATAPDQKPRGIRSLAAKMNDAIHDGSWLVSDEWPSTASASSSAGLDMLGQVSHVTTFREQDSGVHSNDIESDFARFKPWMRTKFASMRVGNQRTEDAKRAHLARKLVEYVFYTSVGSNMTDVMLAVQHSALQHE